MYPRLMAAAALSDAPDGAYPMMFGFVSLLATMSAAATSDYVVDAGTVRFCGAEHHRWLLAAALKTGLLSKVRGKVHGVEGYKLIDDPNFLHIRLKAEMDWEAQQRNDTRDPRIAVPVRARDGDHCRYCRVLVHWAGRTSPRKGTLDHLVPKDADGNRPPATPDTIVVACLSCNSEMRDSGGEDRATLLDPPAEPFYRKATAEWLTKNGRPTRATDGTEQRPAPTTADTALSARQRPATADTARAADSDPALAGYRAADTNSQDQHRPPESPRLNQLSQVDKRDSPGAGRVGSGNGPISGSGTQPTNAGSARRKRSPRGRQHRPPPGSNE